MRTEFLSLRTKTSMLSLSIVDIGCHHPRRQRSRRGERRKKQNVHPFIVASLNAQSVKGNDMAYRHYEISTSIKDNHVDLFSMIET